MKDQNTIIQEGLIARIRELEAQVANRDYAIYLMSYFIEMASGGDSGSYLGAELADNYIYFTDDSCHNDEAEYNGVRIDLDEVACVMLSYFKNHETDDESAILVLQKYISSDAANSLANK